MVQPSYTVNTRENYTLGGGDLFGTAAMIALADWGEVGVVKEFSSVTELIAYYKSGQMVTAANRFFDGGGRVIQTVRVAGTDKAKATTTLKNTGVDAITLDAKFFGTYGNSISVTVLTNGSNRDVLIQAGTTVERYVNLATNQAIVDAINASSNYLVATKDTDDLVDAQTATNLLGGLNGNTITSTDYGTIIEDVLVTKDWDYLITPGQTDDAFHSTMGVYMRTRAEEENRYSTYLCGVTKFEPIATTTSRTAISQEGNIVCCHTSFFAGQTANDTTLADTNNWLDATYTAAVYCGLLCSLPVNNSPTFKSINMIGGKSLAERNYTNSEREQLIEKGFTVIDLTFTDVYGVILGATRTGNPTIWAFQLDSKRKVDFIKENVFNISKGYIGQVNDQITRQAMKSSINSFMNTITKDRIIEDSEVEVLRGEDPRSVIINTSVLLISEVDYITFNLTLNV